MSKVADFFKGFKERYDAQVVRNARLDTFLSKQEARDKEMTELTHTIEILNGSVASLQKEVKTMGQDLNDIHTTLDIIRKGTKIELLDTLYHWKKLLVKRGWRTAAEMKEIQKIYEVYHTGLDGNGQGESYYEIIKNLPEKEVEHLNN